MARPALLTKTALPARFRRPRIGLIGFGDVGQRMLASAPSRARVLAVARSTGWNVDDHRVCDRLARALTHWVVLVPPPSPADQPQLRTDPRARRLVISVGRARGQFLRAARHAGRRLPIFQGVYVSTTGVYGDHAGAWVDETSPCRPSNARSWRRLDAERQFQRLGFPVLRVPGIIGHDRLPVDRIREGRPALRPEEDVYTSHIHADDLARAGWLALWRGWRARVVNVADQDPLPMGAYFDRVAEAAGLPKVPRIRRAELPSLVAQGQLSAMAASFFSDSRRIRADRLRRELRLVLQWPRLSPLLQAVFGQGQAPRA